MNDCTFMPFSTTKFIPRLLGGQISVLDHSSLVKALQAVYEILIELRKPCLHHMGTNIQSRNEIVNNMSASKTGMQ